MDLKYCLYIIFGFRSVAIPERQHSRQLENIFPDKKEKLQALIKTKQTDLKTKQLSSTC
ncbi:MAG: hypothetical protein ABIO53_15110 [Chitinophagaceae bacterium]